MLSEFLSRRRQMHWKFKVRWSELFLILSWLYSACVSFANLDDIAVLCILEKVFILLLLLYGLVQRTRLVFIVLCLFWSDHYWTLARLFCEDLAFYFSLPDIGWSSCFLDNFFSKYLLVQLLVVVYWISDVLDLVVLQFFDNRMNALVDGLVYNQKCIRNINTVFSTTPVLMP